MSWLGDCFDRHGCSYGGGGSHAEFLKNFGNVFALTEFEGLVLPILVDHTPKQPFGGSEILDLKPFGECNREVGDEFSYLAREDGVVDIYRQNVDEPLVACREDSWVYKRLSEPIGDEPGCKEGIPGLWSLSNTVESFLQVTYKASSVRTSSMVSLRLLHTCNYLI